jgi:hypothetical protein
MEIEFNVFLQRNLCFKNKRHKIFFEKKKKMKIRNIEILKKLHKMILLLSYSEAMKSLNQFYYVVLYITLAYAFK